eukprot:scaffold1083_cov114-Cylindrotheca_fusiformis.AAC.6
MVITRNASMPLCALLILVKLPQSIMCRRKSKHEKASTLGMSTFAPNPPSPLSSLFPSTTFNLTPDSATPIRLAAEATRIPASLQIHFIQMTLMNSQEGGSTMTSDLHNRATNFITVLLETKCGIEALDLLPFEFNVSPSSIVYKNLDSGFTVRMAGAFFYHENALSGDSLQELISKHFSCCGIGALEPLLNRHCLESSKFGDTFLGYILVATIAEEDRSIARRSPGNGIRKKWRSVVSSISGVATILLISCSIYRRNRKNEKKKIHWARYLFSKRHRRTSSGGDIVTHVTVRESEVVLPNQHNDGSLPSYDVGRLDRVISDAKQQASLSFACRRRNR